MAVLNAARTAALTDAWYAAYAGSRYVQRVSTGEAPAQAALVCDIFGNPFRPVTVDPNWLTPTVVAIARRVYDERDFAALPVLGDALEEAGCASEDVLRHCREQGEHARGCWVVDHVLGKE
jgi:hypothetical protein